jgi:hypothetical protein
MANSYNELLEVTNMWKADLEEGRSKGDFGGLAKFFRNDCEFTWTVFGHNSEFIRPEPFRAVGPQAIVDAIKKDDLFGLYDWSYPWLYQLIDPVKSTIIYYYQAISPYKKDDGTFFKTNTTGVTRLHYVGNRQFDLVDNLYDYEYQHDLEKELIARKLAPADMVERVKNNEAQLAEDRKRFAAHLEEMRKISPQYLAKFGEQIKRETATKKKK